MKNDLRIPAIERSEPFTITVDGRIIEAYPGETVLSAMIAAGLKTLRISPVGHQPRGALCGMGACYECVVTADGVPHVRSCMLEAKPGMEILLEKTAI